MGGFKLGLIVVLGAIVVYLLLQKKAQYNPDDVKGLNVVVTGASSGIGEQIAYKFASMGANLMITARTEAKLQKVVQKCKELGSPEAHYVAASQYSYKNASLVISGALEKLGGIDILVLNHFGQTYFGGYRYDVSDVESLMMANMLTHAHMSDLAMSMLQKRKGRIVVTSSATAVFGGLFTIPYVTTKFALEGFFTSLRHELLYNKTDVSVTISRLGFIDTKSVRHLRKYVDQKQSSPEEAAAETIRGAMTRESVVYLPDEIYYGAILNSIMPDTIGVKVRSSMHYP